MRIYIGFDDTDTADSGRGTGKLARWFEQLLPQGCRQWAVIRQQLPRLAGIPFTSNNSSACVVLDAVSPEIVPDLVSLAAGHIEAHFVSGSDPGLCVLAADSPAVPRLMAFGRECCNRIVTQREAMDATRGVHLSGHGGTNDGIIGAAAAIGLTLSGWSGRLIEFGGLRDFPARVPVGALEQGGIRVLALERDALPPDPDDLVETHGWLRPRWWGFEPVLPVRRTAPAAWEVLFTKRKPPQAHAAKMSEAV